MKVGIESINYYVPKFYLDMSTLAEARGVDEAKYKKGIGQHKMAVISPLEDIVTMAIEAAYDMVQPYKDDIDTILFATESAIDYSKAAGNYVHRMLGLPSSVRILELKQACYAATGALQLACDYVRMQPNKKVLVLSSDIAWYGFESAGESTQGAGAIAMLVSKDPKVAVVNRGTFTTEELPDFYRPSYQEVPTVDGRLSINCYNDMLQKVDPNESFEYTCFHMPFAKMANKANKVYSHPQSKEQLDIVKYFTQEVGNIYNGSLFLSLISVLSLSKASLAGKRIGMFSYGSGAVGEFFSLDIQKDYDQFVSKTSFLDQLKHRQAIDLDTYISFMTKHMDKEKNHQLDTSFTPHPTMRFVLEDVTDGHRKYKKIA
ncbi:MAG: hydroxymethylglutaryl-CoA synthase [Acholeplasmataceae bacterium]